MTCQRNFQRDSNVFKIRDLFGNLNQVSIVGPSEWLAHMPSRLVFKIRCKCKNVFLTYIVTYAYIGDSVDIF